MTVFDLSVTRTNLSNQRTLMAFVQTTLAFVGLGIILLQIVKSPGHNTSGIACLCVSGVVAIIGLCLYFQQQSHIRNTRNTTFPSNHIY